MKYVLHLLIFCGIFFLSTGSTASYVRTPLNNSNGLPIAWNLTNPGTPIVNGGRITYSLNPAGSDDLPFSQIERAIASSFQSWEDVPTSNVAFARGPNTTSTSTTNDGVLQLFWLENTESTADGLNLAGAVALTRRTYFTSGNRTGEITDAATVFNGFRYKWSVDGRSDAVDVQEVATHEIGHILGLAHTPIGGATMYPLTIAGRTQARSLAPDDEIAVSVSYPAPNFSGTTGTLRGRVSDSSGANVFGAHIVAVDLNGNVKASALSQPDGIYSIQGLPPGNYTVYAEPLDPVNGAYFSRANLEGFYANANVNFLNSQDFQANITAGGTSTLDIAVTRGAPTMDGYLVRGPESTFFFNLGAQTVQGQINATIGVGGIGLPQNGSPLNVSGSGITINRTFFTSFDGLPAVMAEITVSPTAIPGSRNIIITQGQQRTIMTGALEIVPSTAAVVSSASFTPQVASDSLATVFGQNLATGTASVSGQSLPTTLGGATVRLRDNSGQELLAPLFFASPNQINFQISPNLLRGTVLIKVGNNDSFVSNGSLFLESIAPGLFSASGTGQGLAAAVALRIKPNGAQIFEPVARFDSSSGQFVPVPIDLAPVADQVFLVLFGTGVRFRSALSTVSYNVGGVTGTPIYAGAQGDFVGLDQINIPLTQNLAGRGLVNVFLTMEGKITNRVNVSIK